MVGDVAAGLKNAEIAKALFVSVDAIKKHLSRVFGKLCLRDRVELVLWA